HQGGQEKRIGKADHQITDVGQNSHRQTDQQLPPDVISQRLVDVPQHAQDLLPPVSGKKADEGTFDHLGILQHVIHQKGNDQRQKQLVKGGPQSRHEVADAVGDGLFQPVQGFFDSRSNAFRKQVLVVVVLLNPGLNLHVPLGKVLGQFLHLGVQQGRHVDKDNADRKNEQRIDEKHRHGTGQRPPGDEIDEGRKDVGSDDGNHIGHEYRLQKVKQPFEERGDLHQQKNDSQDDQRHERQIH